MKPKVLLYSKLNQTVMSKLEETLDVIFVEKHDPQFAEKIAPHLSVVEGIIGDGLKISTSLLEKATNLKVISNISVGYDNLDMKAINKRAIIATNTPDVLTETTADLMFTLLLSTARRVAQLDRYVKGGQWKRPIDSELFGTDVHGKKLGMIGMGRIGQAIARRGRFGFQMPILYHNRSRKMDGEKELDASYCTLKELLTEADFVCLMTPLTKETRHLIGEEEFALMKESAIFINGSRGHTVDEQALINALETKQIKAAGLDVYQEEPIRIDNRLLQMDHVITLPHVGSDTDENRLAMDELATENMIKVLQGEKPLTPICN